MTVADNMRSGLARTLVFFLDPIESSSYPVTETGYALMHRAYERAKLDGDNLFVVYPDTTLRYAPWEHDGSTQPYVQAHRVEDFSQSPYHYYRSQRENYDAQADLGSTRCHREAPACELCLADSDAVVFRQETGDPVHRHALLQALAHVERETVVYLSPRLALHPQLGSKTLPWMIAPDRTPRTFHTDHCTPDADSVDKVNAALMFIQDELGNPDTVIAKPLLGGDNGKGIEILGKHPVTGHTHPTDARALLMQMQGNYGDLVIQEYLPSVRAPSDVTEASLADVSPTRHDFGEIRFLLIDGTIPRTHDGRDIMVARRVPADHSLVADSGISYATELTRQERAFLKHVGRYYVRLGIYFGGGDLIRTPEKNRPFLFTDAARSVCGHAVVTGALNGDPYLIIDQVLDSLERRIAAQSPAALSATDRWVGRIGQTPYS